MQGTGGHNHLHDVTVLIFLLWLEFAICSPWLENYTRFSSTGWNLDAGTSSLPTKFRSWYGLVHFFHFNTSSLKTHFVIYPMSNIEQTFVYCNGYKTMEALKEFILTTQELILSYFKRDSHINVTVTCRARAGMIICMM